MRSKDFIPTAQLGISTSCILQIRLVIENGEAFVYSAFYDVSGQRKSSVTKSHIRESNRGHAFFYKNRERYYLNDFVKKPSPQQG